MRTKTALFASLLTTGVAATAGAFAPTPKGDQPMETADATEPPRAYRDVAHAAPAAAQAAVARVAAAGLGNVVWDVDTGVPAQLWGAGIGAPQAMTSPAAAEAAARAFLAEHLALLAPGSSAADFIAVGNELAGDLRVVGLAQHRGSARVLGANIGFLFKNDRLIVVTSTALPDVTATASNRSWKPGVLETSAGDWIANATGRTPVASAPTAAETVLPIVRRRTATGRNIEYRTVHTVQVKLADGVGQWDVYVDARTGAPLARKSLIKHAQGTIVYNVPPRWPGGGRQNYAAARTTHNVNGGPVTSTPDGSVTWSGAAAATVSPGLAGPWVRLFNSGGSLATTSLSLAPDMQATWNESSNGSRDAQLTAFIHAGVVKDYVKTNIAPGETFVDQQLEVYVNEDGNCNAYSTGDDIHFFVADGQCENTARLADVVYHEFGHSLHAHAIIPGVGDFDGALSEGTSDFLAATITGDPGMGRGFFYTEAALRHIDPPNGELSWPDNVTGQPHSDGEIIGGTLWDLRKALIARLGETAGTRRAEMLYYAIIQTSSDIPSTFASALAADDDDGNLDNGTPNHCAIRQAFAAHGLADLGLQSGGVSLPMRDGLTVSVAVTAPGMASECPPPTVESGELLWSVRDVGGGGTIPMTETDLGGGNSNWSAVIPPQTDHTVVRYQVRLTLTDGTQKSLPENPADTYYEMYVGQVEPIWCDDFEDGAGEWTHGFDAGTDDWESGFPMGLAEDPDAAAAGSWVFGTDLSGDGLYRRNSETWARTPVIDVTGREGVRLHYKRWLNIEDGFYDGASIVVDGNPRWGNFASQTEQGATVSHRDSEWRFQDVDLAADAADGSVQVEFRLTSDQGLEFGGWTMDDVCIVARLPGGTCGDGTTAGVEQCDDGNTTDGDGCSALCTTEDDINPIDEGGCCSTGTGPGGSGFLALGTLALVLRRRRRNRS
jgi:MYXO-CTERM domain-containing protein